VSATAPFSIESVAQVHALVGRAPPPHPLVSVIAASWQPPLDITIPVVGRAITTGLYVISLKSGDECHAEFGRQLHDGAAGVVVFASPGQTITPTGGKTAPDRAGDGWSVIFHPDLLRESPVAAAMHRFRFFGYAEREALHLTEPEQKQLTQVVRQLEHEASSPPDAFAQDALTAQLQLLFSWCQRGYARQFAVRTREGGAVAAKLDRHLDGCFASAGRAGEAVPTVRSCARALGYSPDYLSDLLRAETGKSARDHIHHAIVEAAKARLLSSEATVSEVAHALGFEHPQHFSKLFARRTGQSPGEWRRRQ